MSFAAPASTGRFRIEDAIQGTFGAVFANFGVFFLLALLLWALPNFVAQAAFRADPATINTAPGVFLTGLFLKPLVAMAAAALLQGALTRGVVDHLNGVKPRFAPCLRAGLVAAPPLVAIGLLFGIAVVVGLFCLLAPGLFLVALWTPAAAVCVVERRGVFGSFSRAGDLTYGHRWAVLVAIVVMFVAGLVVGLVGGAIVGAVAAALGGPAGLAGALTGGGSFGPVFIAVAAVNALSGAVASLFTSGAPAAIYYGLRRSREGVGPAELAAVFD